MYFFSELLVEVLLTIIFEGSLEVLKSKNASWILKAICLIFWIGLIAGLSYLGFSFLRHSDYLLSFLMLFLASIAAVGFTYSLMQGTKCLRHINSPAPHS